MHHSVLLRRPALPTVGRLTTRFVKAAAASSRRAPAPSTAHLRRNTAARKRNVPKSLTPDNTNSLIAAIRFEIIKTAIADGIINIGFADALDVARKCVYAATKGNSPTSIKLSEVIGKDPSQIARVAFVLSRSAALNPVANWVTQSLAEEKELISTILANNALLNEDTGPVKETKSVLNLKSIVEEGRSPQAMVLYGLIQQRNDQSVKAAQLFEKAMAISKPVNQNRSLDIILRSGIPQPWAAYSSLKKELGQPDGVKEALTVGAEVYDSALAHKLLSPEILHARDFDKYEKYLTKSAMSNDAASCHQLGTLYLATYIGKMKSEKGTGTSGENKITQDNNDSSGAQEIGLTPRYSIPEYRQLAIEWYELAIAGKYGRAALVLAGLFRQENKIDQGLKYLDLAGNDSRCSQDTALLRGLWNDTDFKIDLKSLMGIK